MNNGRREVEVAKKKKKRRKKSVEKEGEEEEEEGCRCVSRVLPFCFFSVGDRVIAGQLHNERETKSETGSKCLCRSDNGISGRLLRER